MVQWGKITCSSIVCHYPAEGLIAAYSGGHGLHGMQCVFSLGWGIPGERHKQQIYHLPARIFGQEINSMRVGIGQIILALLTLALLIV